MKITVVIGVTIGIIAFSCACALPVSPISGIPIAIKYIDCGPSRDHISVAATDYSTFKIFPINATDAVSNGVVHDIEIHLRPGIYVVNLSRPRCSANVTVATATAASGPMEYVVMGRPILTLGSFGNIVGNLPPSVRQAQAVCETSRSDDVYPALINGGAYQITGITLPATCRIEVWFTSDPPVTVTVQKDLMLGGAHTQAPYALVLHADIKMTDVINSVQRCAAMLAALQSDAQGNLKTKTWHANRQLDFRHSCSPRPTIISKPTSRARSSMS